MKILFLLFLLSLVTPGDAINGKGTKSSASSARGKPELFRGVPNVCVCDEDTPCDCVCDEKDVLSCGCYAALIDKEIKLVETECGGEDNADCDGLLSQFWGTIRDDILTAKVEKPFDLDGDGDCWAELSTMLIEEDETFQDLPKFQAIIRKIKIRKNANNYRSIPVVVDIVGPQAVSDIKVEICFVCDGQDDDCDGVASKCSGIIGFGTFVKQTSYTFASPDFGLTIKSKLRGGVPRIPVVTGELMGSEATFTAKLGLEDVSAKLFDFLGDGSSNSIADIVINFMAYDEDGELLDSSETGATASLNALGDVIMCRYGDIIIGGMPIDDFYD